METEGFFQFEIIINVLVSPFWFIWIPIDVMNLHLLQIFSFSAGIVFKCQNLASVDARFWRLNTVPALRGWFTSKQVYCPLALRCGIMNTIHTSPVTVTILAMLLYISSKRNDVPPLTRRKHGISLKISLQQAGTEPTREVIVVWQSATLYQSIHHAPLQINTLSGVLDINP